MTVKYHISPVTGKPEKCTATKRPCKYGASTKHYESKAAANEAAEKLNEAKAASTKLAKKSAPAGAIHVHSKRPSRTGFRLSALDDASRTLLERSKEEGAKSTPPAHDIWEYNSGALMMAGLAVRNLRKRYDATEHSYKDEVKALSELISERSDSSSAESSILVSKADPKIKKEIFNTIDSALPERLQGRLTTRVNRYIKNGGKLTDDYKDAKSRVFVSTRKTLSELDKKLADHKGDKYSHTMRNISKYAKAITSMSCEGKPDDDAVLTVRMCELRDECFKKNLELEVGRNPAYEDAVDIINSNLPDSL